MAQHGASPALDVRGACGVVNDYAFANPPLVGRESLGGDEMRPRNLLVLALLCAPSYVRCQERWREARHPHYTIFYQPGLDHDAAEVQGWADRTEQVMAAKYHVRPIHYYMSIYLLATPTAQIDVSHARNTCCSPSPGRDSTGRIEMLAPSSDTMGTTTEVSSLRLPKSDSNYQAKILTSEYIPIGHYEVQNRRPRGGWHYYDAPNWFVQGLQEYDAIFHSTAYNRTETARRLMAWAQAHRAVFKCSGADLTISDDYNGGATFMAFLAVTFGEDVHRRILASEAPTFAAALTAVTRPFKPHQLCQRFEEWLNASPSLLAR